MSFISYQVVSLRCKICDPFHRRSMYSYAIQVKARMTSWPPNSIYREITFLSLYRFICKMEIFKDILPHVKYLFSCYSNAWQFWFILFYLMQSCIILRYCNKMISFTFWSFCHDVSRWTYGSGWVLRAICVVIWCKHMHVAMLINVKPYELLARFKDFDKP